MKRMSWVLGIWMLALCAPLAGCKPNPTAVPNVVGLAQVAAETTITDAGLTVGVVGEEFNASVPVGSVVSQDPTVGAIVALGDAVSLVISKGPQPVTVSNVMGLTQAAASADITSIGLVVGTIMQEHSSAIAAGMVINQTPAPGTLISPGSVVVLTVSIGPKQYTLMYTAGTNGMLSGASSQAVNSGTSGTAVTAFANLGYHFLRWSDGSTQNPRIDINVTADVSVTAIFAITTYALAYAVGPNGTVTGITSQEVDYGGSGTDVTAVPDTGYHFVQWSDGSVQNPRADINVTADIAVAAEFAITTHTLTYTAGPNGVIVGATPQKVDYRSSGTNVTAVPSTGYHFAQWSDGLTQNPRTDMNVTADVSVTANFATITYTLTYAAGLNGAVTGITSQEVDYGGSGTDITPVPNTGYHFVQWSDGSAQNPRRDVNVTAIISVTALFAEIPKHTLITSVISGHGTLGPASGTQYYENTVVDLMATPEFGYRVKTWTGSDNVPSTSVLNTVTMDADKMVTVEFELIPPQHTLITSVVNGHGILAPPTGNQYDENSVVTLSALPDAGCHVKSWTGADNEPSSAATNTVTMSTDRTVSVEFEGPLAGDLVSVPEGTFVMGNSGVDEDQYYNYPEEFPAHSVHLSAYRIGKYDVTNQQYADILNWALARGYLQSSDGGVFANGDVYAAGQRLLNTTDILFSNGVFAPATRAGAPAPTIYSMALNPVVNVTWHGAAIYCNWLSQSQGLTPCYDTSGIDMLPTAWPCDIAAGGYYLPTEAQWERAAAWDVSQNKHWVYGFTSDSLNTDRNSGSQYCNFYYYYYLEYYPTLLWNWVNPLGLTDQPYTSPVGWFNGINVSPNGNVQTEDSPSPVGCYDMNGNVWQWCTDWFDGTFYQRSSVDNPVNKIVQSSGSTLLSEKVIRGGSWDNMLFYFRTAGRASMPPDGWRNIGFRVSIGETEGEGEGEGEGEHQAGDTDTVLLPSNVPLEMVWIPKGTFMMGSLTTEPSSGSSEWPQHQVTLTRGFWMGKYELTKSQWTSVMGTTPWEGQDYAFNDPNSPAVYLSWNDAHDFITALNAGAGQTFRLPSESEWERACRAGTSTWFYWGDDPNWATGDSYVWCQWNTLEIGEWYAHVVGLKLPNAWGLYDMGGNVFEWCQDWSGDYPLVSVVDPKGPPRGSYRISRGGAWSRDFGECRSAARNSDEPANARSAVGLRLVR